MDSYICLAVLTLLCWIDHRTPVLDFIYLRRIAIPFLFGPVMKTLRPLR
jgi:hypothetical protein